MHDTAQSTYDTRPDEIFPVNIPRVGGRNMAIRYDVNNADVSTSTTISETLPRPPYTDSILKIWSYQHLITPC